MAERNLETSPLYKLTITGRQADRQTGRQADRQKKPLIGARACALPKKKCFSTKVTIRHQVRRAVWVLNRRTRRVVEKEGGTLNINTYISNQIYITYTVYDFCVKQSISQ